MEPRYKLATFLLLAVALDSSALTLGRIRGAALVGQPLDVTVQAQLAPDESAGNLCAEADVFHADTRQDGARVRVSVEPGQGQTANIRVQSSNAVDEPMVTVYLKVGCGQKSNRRYVMLADFPSEQAAPQGAAPVTLPYTVAPPAVAVSPAPAAVSPAAGTGQDGAAPATGSAAPAGAAVAPVMAKPKPVVVRKPVKRPVAPKAAAPKPVPAQAVTKPEPAPLVEKPADKPAEKTPAKAPAKSAAEEKLAAGREAGQSRLKLDPLITLSDRVAALETAASAPAAPDAAREAQRVQTLEESVKTLVALAAKNEASMLQMRAQLQKAESERVSMGWLYGLGALLLACLGAMGWLWSRQRQGAAAMAAASDKDEWWSGSKSAALAAGGPVSARAALDQDGGTEPPSTQPPRRAQPALRDDAESEMDVSLVEMSESNFDNLMQSGQAHSALRKGPLPRQAPPEPTRAQPLEVARTINSDQVFDVRQQAEFFVSLGQTDQAVRILESRIHESGESSPLLYLDLLNIFHSLGLKQDYHQFREDFNLLFNSRVPEFDDYGKEGRSLEEYPHVLAHIAALWPTPKALMVIEASVFRDPVDESGKPFDLAAFRDLLLLHALAQSNARGGPVNSNLAPLSSSAPAAGRSAGTVAVAKKDAGKSGAVDIALDTQNGMLTPAGAAPGPAALDVDLTDLVAPSVLPAEEETEFPTLPPVPGADKPAANSTGKAGAKSVQAIEDNNFLDFDKNVTVNYKLPPKKP